MKISEMTIVTSLTGLEYLPVVDPSEPIVKDRNKRILLNTLKGSDGSIFHIGVEDPPSNTLGENTDIYLNIDNRKIFQKTPTEWVLKGILSADENVVRSVNGKLPDLLGNVQLEINDITGLSEALNNLETEIQTLISNLAAPSGANLVGFSTTENYNVGTSGYALKTLLGS